MATKTITREELERRVAKPQDPIGGLAPRACDSDARRRFLADRLEGLRARYRGQPPTVLTPAMEALTGPHLHWSVRLNGARVDPLSLIAAAR